MDAAIEDALLTVGQGIGATGVATYIWCGIWLYTVRMGLVRPKREPVRVRKVFRLAKRLFWLSFALRWGCDVALHGPLDGWGALWFLNCIWCYYSLKNEDDDDVWKRLRARVDATVQSLGHRLVVRPTGS